MRYFDIRSWSLDNTASPNLVPIDFYLALTDEAKQSSSLEQAIRQAANILNRLLFPMFQFKVDRQAPSDEKIRHIRVDGFGCKAALGAREDMKGNKNGYVSCFIGGGWRGDWKTHNVDSIIHELLHTIGRRHEQMQPDSLGLIQYINNNYKLPSEDFLEYYDPWSPMHYSLNLIKVVLGGGGGGSVAPKATVIESLANQGYPPKLATDYYEALLGLNENNGNFDTFNLGFGLLTQRDFNTLRKTACIIDPKMCALEQATPVFAFTANNKISYRYLLKLTKIFINPWYQRQKLIVVADTKQLEINSSHCYMVNLKDLFQVYPKEQNINCEVVTTVLQRSNITQFSDSDFPRKEGDRCTLVIEKGFLDLWNSSLQSKITFYSNDRPTAKSSSTLYLWPINLLHNATFNESSSCISPNSTPFNVVYNTTLTPFLNSEEVPGSLLDYYEKNKYFSRLAQNAVPFFAAGLITGISNCAEWIVSSYFNKNLFNASAYKKHLTQLIKLFIHIGLTSYAIHQHIIEEKARQILIPLLDENRQLFQTADLMDRLNSDEFLSLIIPYTVNTAAILVSILITPISQHWSARFGLTNALAILTACLANQGNPYSYLELAIGISVHTGGALIGYCLTWGGLLVLQKLKTHLQFRRLSVIDTPAKENDIRISLIENEEPVNHQVSSPKETLTMADAMRHAWNTVSFSSFTRTVSHSTFFNFCRTSEKNEKIDFRDHFRSPAVRTKR